MPITAIEETGVSATYLTLSDVRTRSPDPVVMQETIDVATLGISCLPFPFAPIAVC
jgi:hypothetical protein